MFKQAIKLKTSTPTPQTTQQTNNSISLKRIFSKKVTEQLQKVKIQLPELITNESTRFKHQHSEQDIYQVK